MLCEEERDESEVLTGVGPGAPPLGHCLGGCCGYNVTVQIRTRFGGGMARLCAEFVDAGGDPDLYHTTLESVTTYTAWDAAPNPDEVVRSCVRTTSYNSGTAAIVSWGGTDTAPDCGAESPDTSYTPENCLDTLLDAPADYSTESTTSTYSGDTGTQADVRAAAVSAFAWGEWSEWTDLVAIDALTGSYEGGYLEHYLAGAARGSGGTPYEAEVSQFESELRVIGAYSVHLAVGAGAGALADLPIVRHILTPGTPLSFGSSMPTWAEDWQASEKVLRCVCPLRFAPAVA